MKYFLFLISIIVVLNLMSIDNFKTGGCTDKWLCNQDCNSKYTEGSIDFLNCRLECKQNNPC